jgi:hypothetical protein
MSAILDTILPVASTVLGGGGGWLSARSAQFIEVQAQKEAQAKAHELDLLRLAQDKDEKQNEINIQPTYYHTKFGINWDGKFYGIEWQREKKALLMSPVNVCKFFIALLLAYGYLNVWLYNAVHNQKVVRTITPEPNGYKLDFFGLFSFERAVHVIADLNLGGLAATTMAQPVIAIIAYVVTNLTYKSLVKP